MLIYLSKSLLPIFIIFSYTITPVFANDDDEIIHELELNERLVSVSKAVNDHKIPITKAFRQRGTNLCLLDANFFNERPDLSNVTLREVLDGGAQFDVTSTSLRLVNSNTECSQELKTGAESCQICRDNPKSKSKPQHRFMKAFYSMGVPHETGADLSRKLSFAVGDGFFMTCHLDVGLSEPIKASKIFTSDVKVSVPCNRLQPTATEPAP